MQRSSAYKLHRLFYVHLPWSLALLSSYSVLATLYRGEILWTALGTMGIIILTNKAMTSSAVDFHEREQIWLRIDEKLRTKGHEPPVLSLRDAIKIFRS